MKVSPAVSDESIAFSATSEVGDGAGSGMADAAVSVCVVGTLVQPAIAMPSASTHQRVPLITLSSPTRVHGCFTTDLQTGAPFRAIRPSKKKLCGRRRQCP